MSASADINISGQISAYLCCKNRTAMRYGGLTAPLGQLHAAHVLAPSSMQQPPPQALTSWHIMVNAT